MRGKPKVKDRKPWEGGKVEQISGEVRNGKQCILGVDPSLRSTGYGIVECQGRGRLRLVSCGTIRVARKASIGSCLQALQSEMERIVGEFAPQVAAVEKVIFVQSIRTALDLGAARGVILLTLARRLIPVYEYPPRLVKLGVSGKGQAQKRQVAFMVKSLLGLSQPPSPDVADALAVALAHLHRNWAISVGSGRV